MNSGRSFEELVNEAASVSVDGWDFSWLEGRAREERPSWGYSRLLLRRLAGATSVLDIQTGGGEVFAEVLSHMDPRPPATEATESWPPNVAVAKRNLSPYAASVTQVNDEEILPFPDGYFDFIVSRHPTTINWPEIERLLRPGATYLSQQVGPGTHHELTEFMVGTHTISATRSAEGAVQAATAFGLALVDLRHESLRVEFFDIGAVVYFLRKVVWTVPGFSVELYRSQLMRLYHLIEEEGSFVSHAERYLIEVVKPIPRGQ